MSRVVLRPFTAADLEPAGVALAARQAAHRRVEPALPARFEDPAGCTGWLRTVWQAEGASGTVALDGPRFAGYLLGAPKPEHPWGPNAWVESAGVAVADPETARDLYALAAQRWMDEGRTAHCVVVPAPDRALVDAFSRLCFGQQHAHALREPAAPGAEAGVARLDLALPQHQALSPVFSSGGMPTVEEARAEWEESVDDPAFTTFVAEADAEVVGSAIGCSLELSGLHTGPARPEGGRGSSASRRCCRRRGAAASAGCSGRP